MSLPSPNTLEIFTQAVRSFQAGQLVEAERLCRQIPPGNSPHADSRHLLGLIFFRAGQPLPAADFIRQAISLDGQNASYHANLAMILLASGRAEESVSAYRQAVRLKPDFPEAHRGLADALYGLGRLEDAQASYRAALALQPDDVDAHVNLGGILSLQGSTDRAIIHYRRAIALQPGSATAHVNLANALWAQGKLDEAVAAYWQTITLKPDHAQAHNNLGAALRQQDRTNEAEAVYRHMLTADPDNVAALTDLAFLLAARGDNHAALALITHALRVAETPEVKRTFTAIVRPMRWSKDNPALRALLAGALTEPWARPREVAWAVSSLLTCNPKIVAATSADDRLSLRDVLDIAGDILLLAFLESVPNVDPDLEKLLTAARRLLMEEAGATQDNALLQLHAALAQQCFVNEYVFSQTDEEISKAEHLRDTLLAARREGKTMPPSWLLAVASYFPLHSMAQAETLLEDVWPDAVAAVLTQQIREPFTEMQLRTTIPRLTPIDDTVSQRVQAQYEENPYPRWVKLAPPLPTESLARSLPSRFPQAILPQAILNGAHDHLVAGCGTGQQSIEAALREPGSRILAIDLSAASLAYAERKSRELGLRNIEHAQADILAVAGLERDFDFIECVGVLHHLADPFAGWAALLSRLRPGGIMTVGLYSEPARRAIARARQDIAARGYGTRPDDIRRYRQDILRDGDTGHVSLAKSGDFYSLSACRDMLFHVQEHRLTLPQIDAFLRAKNLEFLGFLIDDSVLRAYRQRFPGDPAGTDLAQWDIFERENPDTFTNMYWFCVRKK